MAYFRKVAEPQPQSFGHGAPENTSPTGAKERPWSIKSKRGRADHTTSGTCRACSFRQWLVDEMNLSTVRRLSGKCVSLVFEVGSTLQVNKQTGSALSIFFSGRLPSFQEWVLLIRDRTELALWFPAVAAACLTNVVLAFLRVD